MLVAFLQVNVNVFAWQPSDIPGVPEEVIEHHLAICPHARPIKKKVRKQALERQEFITEEIRKLEAAGLVRGVLHPTWLANPVVVRMANGKWRLCIDNIDINKAGPKDPFLLLHIDQIVDSTAGCHSRSPVPRVAGESGRRAEERREGAHVCRLHQPQQGLPSRPVPATAHRPDC